MIFTPAGISKTFLKLNSRKHIYSGPTELTQYFVRLVSIHVMSWDDMLFISLNQKQAPVHPVLCPDNNNCENALNSPTC